MTCLKPATLRVGRDKSHVTGKADVKLTADPLSWSCEAPVRVNTPCLLSDR